MAKSFSSDRKVARRYGVDRATVWRWAASGILPKPKKVGPNTTRWDDDELDQRDEALDQPLTA